MAEQNRIPRNLPVIHVDNIVMYPFLMIPLVVSDEPLKKVIDHALSNDKLLGFFLSYHGKDEGKRQIYDYGCAVSILRMLRNQDGSISLLLQGVSRIRLEKIVKTEPFIMAEIEPIPEMEEATPKILALKKISIELLEKVISESSDVNRELIYGLRNLQQISRVADIIAGNTPILVEQKQELLEAIPLESRFEKLNRFLAETIKQMRLENRIRNNIQLEMDEDQRRYYLREQLEAIMKELGETDEVSQEIQAWTKKIKKANLPDHVKEVAQEELNRLSMMSPASSEYSVIRNYLEWIVNLPWTKKSKDRLDLKKIDTILTHDHYGLDQVKERILEYIAVKKLRDKIKGPILCFVGPPGVGKTSMGHSVARALKRKFIRVSLGGIHDEAEIRGHRRTYIGALPGKILNEIKRAGTSNPVFMLDEIDKVGRDFRGDPASALLETLDPEQNFEFMDNYINLPFDLSDVLFITTANGLETIPPPLLDRMEIITFSSYIEEEKIQIARDYIIPKELENNGLTKKNISFQKSALQEICRYYVHEAGVRGLQRYISAIMRKVARQVAEGKVEKFIITDKNVKDYLKSRRFSPEIANRKPEIGVVTGLAWTAYGGEILFCEATKMPGKGGLIMTGLLGEVMKESARIALSHIKANHTSYHIKKEAFDKTDIHIHFPAGSIPKDGPSAGVTLTTCLVSLLSERKVKHDVAMTGEIDLLGKVMPIGGVREKFLAAKRAGITTVIFPLENKSSFDELPDDLKTGVKVIFSETINDILCEVLMDK